MIAIKLSAAFEQMKLSKVWVKESKPTH